ncbi:ATP synthase F0 subunit A [Candidatus Roizmanbacteria bacterium RIFCSPLOWO2_02_FULL_41_9]|uniref:ATP synthase subunit a n=2 Tax=Candidatus Roizmaniibacteriota TaxID=1752723 RepID=A0A1F7JRH2_9BACT|nr:MAG: ATP synthase F0 subunit A [Candidatus Roizmanbacteria bacterium RIFCSPLOWO2_02_FULL_41_9]
MPHISIKGEPIFEIFGLMVTNSVIATVLVTALFSIIAYLYYQESNKQHKKSFFYVINAFLKIIYDLFYSVLKENTNNFFPLLGGFFFFILLNNWFGLIPGVGSIFIVLKEHEELVKVPLLRASTADLNTTFALALTSVVSTQIFGFSYLGVKTHISKFINVSNPVNFFVGILELIQEFARIISFSFRLFGNIFAGEVLLAIMTFLLPVFFSFFSFPIFGLEIFVGFVQTLVFTMLTAVLINMAIHKQH